MEPFIPLYLSGSTKRFTVPTFFRFLLLFFITFNFLMPCLAISQESRQESTIFGNVLKKENNHPCLGAVVILKNEDKEKTVVGTTDTEGKFLIENVFPGEYKIIASCKDSFQEEKEINILRNQKINVDFKISQWANIAGVVLRSDKLTPVAGVTVHARSSSGYSAAAKTNKEGKFNINRLTNGKYFLEVISDDLFFKKTEFVINDNSDIKEIKLIAFSGEIYGKIKDSNGASVDKAKIVLKTDYSNWDRKRLVEKTTYSMKTGSYMFNNLPPGAYTIQVIAKGYGAIINDVLLSEKKMQVECNFSLPEQGVISGKILGFHPENEVD